MPYGVPVNLVELETKTKDELLEVAKDLELGSVQALRKQDLVFKIMQAKAERRSSQRREVRAARRQIPRVAATPRWTAAPTTNQPSTHRAPSLRRAHRTKGALPANVCPRVPRWRATRATSGVTSA